MKMRIKKTAGGSGVQSVTGNIVNNADPQNPIVTQQPVTTLYSGNGALSDYRVVDLNGKFLVFVEGAHRVLTLDRAVSGKIQLGNAVVADDEAWVDIDLAAKVVSIRRGIYSFLNADTINLIVGIGDMGGAGLNTQFNIYDDRKGYNFNNVQEFADNAAALGGGLHAGDIYRTGDVAKIVH